MELDIFQKTDKIGQEKAKKYLSKIFMQRGYEVEYEQHYEDKGGIDIFLDVIKNGKIIKKYSIEAKDRYFSINKYDDLIIEIDKYNKLISTTSSNYVPLYINTFDDGCIIWDCRKINIKKIGYKSVSPKTLLHLPPKRVMKYAVNKSEAVYIVKDNNN